MSRKREFKHLDWPKMDRKAWELFNLGYDWTKAYQQALDEAVLEAGGEPAPDNWPLDLGGERK